MSDERFLTVEQIKAQHEDIGRATLHGTPPGNWFARWMDDVDVLLGALNIADAGREKAEAERDRALAAPLAPDSDLAPAELALLDAGLAMATELEADIGACGNSPPECEGCAGCQPARDVLLRWARAVVAFRAHVARREWCRCQVCDVPVPDPAPDARPDGPPILCAEHRK